MEKAYIYTALVALSSAGAVAETYVTPRAAVENQDYKTDFISGNYVAPSVGLSVYHTSGVFFDVEGLSYSGDEITHHDELTVSAGYRVTPSIMLFGGWKKTNTEGEEVKGDLLNLGRIERVFDASGPFAGISGRIELDQGSNVGLSAAMGVMDGTLEINDTGSNGFQEEFSGDAVGFSTSGSYNFTIYKNLLGSVGAKYQNYNYGDDIASEEVTSVFAKLAYRF